jgi:hypothetical protein
MNLYLVWSSVASIAATEALAALGDDLSGLIHCIRFFYGWAVLFAVSVWWDNEAQKLRLSRRTLRGTREVSPLDFTHIIRGDGLGIPYLATSRLLPWMKQKVASCYLSVAATDERRHLMISGDPGTGKSTLIHDFLCQIAERAAQDGATFPNPKFRPNNLLLLPLSTDRVSSEDCEFTTPTAPKVLPFDPELKKLECCAEPVIVYDPALEFWQCHGRPERGDVLLHPLFDDCPYWDLADEIQTPLDPKALAMSFIPNKVEGKEKFWDQAPRKILSFLLERMAAERKGTADLLRWLGDPSLIEEMISEFASELSPLIDPKAAPQRSGVLASLNMIAEALKLLPPDDGRARFSFRRWAEKKWTRESRPWVFIGSRPPERDALKPLVSAWLDTAFSKLLVEPGGPKTWVFLDELSSLQRLPKLQTALLEGRKYNVCFVLGFQGRAQLEALYGRVAETLMSAPTIRIFLGTTEPAAARWCAENIGQPELERGTESLTTSAGEGRDSLSTATERRADYLVLPNEIQNLPERTGYLRYKEYLVKFAFGYTEFQDQNIFRERKLPVSKPERRRLKLLTGKLH